MVDEFTDGRAPTTWSRTGDVDAIHANYWLSGVAGHRLKHELSLPLVSTFHTLARVKAETGDAEPARRVEAETEVIGCSDAILASCRAEAAQLVELYGAGPRAHRDRGPRRRPRLLLARRPARRPPGPAPGRPPRAAVRGPHPAAQGGRRRRAGAGRAAPPPPRRPAAWSWAAPAATTARTRSTTCATSSTSSGLAGAVRFVAPQPHHLLSTYYRAADVCVVPSRSESFGLVALEAAACGTPVVAADVGGLTTLVDHGRTGFLVDGRDPGRLRRLRRRHRARRCRARPRAMAAAAVAPGRRLPLVDGRRPAAPGLRRPHRSGPGRVPVSRPASGRARRPGRRDPAGPDELDRLEARDRRLAGRAAGREPGGGRGRPGRAGRAALVRPAAGEQKDDVHRLVHARPAHAALRDLRDAGAGREPRRSSTSTCCAATSGSTAPPSRSAPRTPCSWSARSGCVRLDEAELDRILGLALRLGRAVLPAGHAHRLRQPVQGLIAARASPAGCHRVSQIPDVPVCFHDCSMAGHPGAGTGGAREGTPLPSLGPD